MLAVCAMTPVPQPLPWEQKLKQLQQQRDILLTRLEEVRSALAQRVRHEDAALLARLSIAPLKPRHTGYGLLPTILENAPVVSVQPKQTFYSLKWLQGRLDEELVNADQQAYQLTGTTVLDSLELVNGFEKSLKQIKTLENHLSYHKQWQKAVVRYPEYFAEKNSLVALAREIYTPIRIDESSQEIAALHRQLMQAVAPFRPASGLALVNGEGGGKQLPLTICTDIEDQEFLQTFHSGAQDAFSWSPAARSRQFSVILKWRLIRAYALYPHGPPERGAAIDLDAHLALFPGCHFVLTTGASGTSAITGKHIVLGTDPVSSHTLAHEFGHLLGFEDAYVRGYDGDPGDPFGVVLVEWSGLKDDLMGDPGGGQVSDEMIETLIRAYDAPASLTQSIDKSLAVAFTDRANR
jgi:hypothetical protein